MRLRRMTLQQMRVETGAGSAVGYVYAIAVGTLCSIAVYLLSLEEGRSFPWAGITICFLAALSGPLHGTWRQRHGSARSAPDDSGPVEPG